MEREIPKTIHYCWFGGNLLREKELACIESWKKYLPGYEIKRWDESNWDLRCCDYVSEAYDAKKWAFVSDYARLAILYEYGGLYFDTDVELIRPIDDNILEHGPFMGFETNFDDGAETDGTDAPRLGLYRALLTSYQGDHFVKLDGTYDTTTIVARTTKILTEHGLKSRPGIQEVDGVWIYPRDYFNPKDFQTGDINITENTRSIHHFSMSWLTPPEKRRHEIYARMMKRGMPRRRAEIVSKLLALVEMCDLTYFREKIRKTASGRWTPIRRIEYLVVRRLLGNHVLHEFSAVVIRGLVSRKADLAESLEMIRPAGLRPAPSRGAGGDAGEPGHARQALLERLPAPAARPGTGTRGERPARPDMQRSPQQKTPALPHGSAMQKRASGCGKATTRSFRPSRRSRDAASPARPAAPAAYLHVRVLPDGVPAGMELARDVRPRCPIPVHPPDILLLA